ncbi:MAG: hypothetical protein IIA00_10310 [Proteobacteria bacterium]|nr:hypothetical protein [Pseudomonadota bacterium]
MADGSLKRIADVALGEKVMSFDFAGNRRVASDVTRLFKLRSEGYLVLNGIEVTATHPFAVGADDWLEAGRLKIGDRVVGNGATVIERIARVDEAVEVFNMTVGGAHNFYVCDAGGGAYLAHNKGGGI